MNSGSTQRTGTPSADLDAAIDAVAREMTEGEPSGALRGRVLERFESERRRSSPGVPRWAWAGAAAVVVLVIAAAAWVVSPLRNQDAAQSTIAVQSAVGSPPAALAPARPAVQADAASSQSASAEGMPAAPVRQGRAAAVREVRPSGDAAAEDFHAVPALAEIEPLRFASVEPAPLHVADMEITPIREMPAIEIPSLDGGSHDIQSTDLKKEK